MMSRSLHFIELLVCLANRFQHDLGWNCARRHGIDANLRSKLCGKRPGQGIGTGLRGAIMSTARYRPGTGT